MLFKNARIFIKDEGFVFGSFRIENGRFAQIIRGVPNEEGEELGNACVIPGLVDIHIHGNSDADFSDGNTEGLERMARYLAVNGITSFAPTSMTLPFDELKRAFKTAAALKNAEKRGLARIIGINMEGPYVSEKRAGAQNRAYIRKPDYDEFCRLNEAANGLIKMIDVAPEIDGASDFIKKASAVCRVSVAHTDCDYCTACCAFDNGAKHVTHLFNAMPPIHHRNPGVIGAASERASVTAELICDGIHVHESAVRMAFKLFKGRVCLISDALRCCAMKDGEYMLGGQRVTLRDGEARLSDGTIAGSATNLYRCMMNAIRFGIPAEEAINAATAIPAASIGAGEIGSIECGKLADFIICADSLKIKSVYLGGERV